MKRKTFLLVLAALVVLAVVPGCGSIKIAGNPIGGASEPTFAPTRTPRPTFTPRPNFTDTPAPTNTLAATNTPAAPQPATQAPASPTPTRRPATAVPTKPPATPVPQPTAKPAATAFPYPYKFFSVKCEDSGGVYIEIFVYSNYRDPNSLQAGVRVIASYAQDAPALGDTVLTTGDDGKAQYTLQTQLPAKPGTYYAWIVNSKNERISDFSAPIQINNNKPDDPASCKLAKVFFAGQ